MVDSLDFANSWLRSVRTATTSTYYVHGIMHSQLYIENNASYRDERAGIVDYDACTRSFYMVPCLVEALGAAHFAGRTYNSTYGWQALTDKGNCWLRSGSMGGDSYFPYYYDASSDAVVSAAKEDVKKNFTFNYYMVP